MNNYHCLETIPPTISELILPVNDNDPVTLSWTKPVLTNGSREFFQGYDVSFSQNVFQTTLNERSKRNTQEPESNTVRLDPDATSHTLQYAMSIQ